MIFIILVFLAAFSIEAIGSYVSIVGLSALFAASPVVIILAACLDFGKIISVSFLYKNWSDLNWLMKTYLTIASMVLVTITSAGAFGFLSGEFQKAIADTGTQTIKIQTLEEEKGRLQKRKEEIDAQIAKLPDNNVRGRTQLIKQFGPEVSRLNDRLAIIDKDLPALKIQNVDKETHVGPIMYVAKSFNTTPAEAVKWVIFSIIFVFDPLAIALLIAGNYLIDKRSREKIQVASVGMSMEVSTPVVEPIIAATVPNLATHSTWEDGKVEQVVDEELALVPIEEPIPPFVPECEVCGDDGFHVVGPGDYVDCDECAVEVPVEEVAEIDDTPTPPLKLNRHIKVEEREGREVISLENHIPKSSLESVSDKLADIEPADSGESIQTMKLRTHYYKDDESLSDTVVVGGTKI